MNGYCIRCDKSLYNDARFLSDIGSKLCRDCREELEARHRWRSPIWSVGEPEKVQLSLEPDGVMLKLRLDGVEEPIETLIKVKDLSSIVNWCYTYEPFLDHIESLNMDNGLMCEECGDSAEIIERLKSAMLYKHSVLNLEDTESVSNENVVWLTHKWRCGNGHEFYTDYRGSYQVKAENHEAYQEHLIRFRKKYQR